MRIKDIISDDAETVLTLYRLFSITQRVNDTEDGGRIFILMLWVKKSPASFVRRAPR